MKALLTAIYGKYVAGTSLYTALYKSATRKGLYPDNTPQDETLPFCVYGILTGTFDDTMTDDFNDITVYFNVYTNASSASALDLAGYVMTLFDGATLSPTGFDSLYMLRDSFMPIHNLADDTPVYGYGIHYDVLLES